MSEYLSSREVVQALLDEMTIVDCNNFNAEYKMINSQIHFRYRDGEWNKSTSSLNYFLNSTRFKLKTEWCENLKDKPRLCWVSDVDENPEFGFRPIITLIVGCSTKGIRFNDISGITWRYAKPLSEKKFKFI